MRQMNNVEYYYWNSVKEMVTKQLKPTNLKEALLLLYKTLPQAIRCPTLLHDYFIPPLSLNSIAPFSVPLLC